MCGVDQAAGLDELDGIEGPAAPIALITTSVFIVTVGALALDISISEKSIEWRMRIIQPMLAGGSGRSTHFGHPSQYTCSFSCLSRYPLRPRLRKISWAIL